MARKKANEVTAEDGTKLVEAGTLESGETLYNVKPRVRLTNAQREAVCAAVGAGATFAEMASHYGVSEQSIARIIRLAELAESARPSAPPVEPEFRAMSQVQAVLGPLDADTRSRVLGWCLDRFAPPCIIRLDDKDALDS